VALPEVNKNEPISLEINTFVRGITKVEFAVTEKNFSPVLTGVLIRMKQYEDDKKIVFVGTDGFRLAEYKTHFEGDINEK
jgi:DNA polymerase III sliding clamp (beta) subunit (PCNA family)